MAIRHRTRSQPTTPADSAGVVGYGKPPQATRFQPGKSGNPRGRPRGSINSAKHLRESLSKTMPVTVDGKSTRMRRDQALFEGLLRDALKGDNAARRMLLKAMETIADEERSLEIDTVPAFGSVPGPADHEILERYKQEVISEQLRRQQTPDELDEEDSG